MRLRELAKDLFIFAATTVKYVAGGLLDDPDQRISILLSHGNTHAAGSDAESPFAHLDKLYLQVLQTAFGDSISPRRAAIVKVIIGSAVLILDQLSPASLDSLLGLRSGTTRLVFQHLGSVIAIPQDEHGVIDIIIRHSPISCSTLYGAPSSISTCPLRFTTQLSRCAASRQ